MQDLLHLAAVIKEQLTRCPFIVVFDNVWDGSIFRRDCLNILPEDKPGKRLKLTHHMACLQGQALLPSKLMDIT